MISHVLDTNAVIGLIGGKSKTLVKRILDSPLGSIGVPSIVVHELYFGAQKSARVQQNLETLRLILADFPILDFDLADAFSAGEIRAALVAKGTPIGPYDVLIAGQAKTRKLVVITNNIKEFQRVEGLLVEDWTV